MLCMKWLWILGLAGFVTAVDRGNFKTCSQSGFCKRHRDMQADDSPYKILLDTVVTEASKVSIHILNIKNNLKFKLEVIALESNTARMRITELEPIKERYEPPVGDVLIKEPVQQNLRVDAKDHNSITLSFEQNKIVIQSDPLRIDIVSSGEPVISINSRALLKYEHYRVQPQAPEPAAEEENQGEEGAQDDGEKEPPAPAPVHEEEEEPDMWEETFKSHKDTKPFGPSSVGVDIAFPGFEHVYGIPEHADTLALKSTKNADPYRLYNLDVFEYELNNPMALYGSVPVMLAHNEKRTVGMFWLNAAETWIDISSNIADKNLMSKLVNFVAGGEEIPQIDTHWFSESGIIDVFFMLGPEPRDVFRQYAALTGTTPLPPLFAIAYHQSRWNYNDEQDVLNVDAGFDEHNIPLDVIWLDIEHTDGKKYFTFSQDRFPNPEDMLNKVASRGRKMVCSIDPHIKEDDGYFMYNECRNHDLFIKDRNGKQYKGFCWPGRINCCGMTSCGDWLISSVYFTWDAHKFPNSKDMIDKVASKGRKMVTIVDPHIKRDDNYFMHKEGRDQGLYIKNKDGHDYDGWCWPGSSSWPDFLDPKIREFWANKFMLDQYVGSTLDLFTWNDMNEPSVFNGPEITMHKDAKHYGGWEHRDVHNIYGTYVHRATVEGQLLRCNNEHRPFVLSRAFFAGSQRYGAIWTGDNTGEWGHLKMSLPMVLSLNLVGITFSGADVGGFFRNPDEELLTRWYQAAAYQPFFRAHAHLDTKRREPWLFADRNINAIREAVQARYSLLPYWYTLFYQSEKDGSPLAVPLWVEFPKEKSVFSVENEHLIGTSLLVHPVTDAHSTGVDVYFPGKDEIWYDIDNYKSYLGGNNAHIPVDLHKIPVFQRGGSIIPRRNRMRRSSSLTYNDPFTLVVTLDMKSEAEGHLYMDDYHTFQYQNGQYIYKKFTFSNNQLVSKNADGKAGQFATKAWLERVIVVGARKPNGISIKENDGSIVSLDFTYNDNNKVLTIRKPGVNIANDFTIQLQ